MTPHASLTRLLTLLATAVAVAALLPAAALAGNPLLSGYAGARIERADGPRRGRRGRRLGGGSDNDNNSGASGSLAVTATTNTASGGANATGSSSRSSSGSGSTLKSTPHRKNSASHTSSHTKQQHQSTGSTHILQQPDIERDDDDRPPGRAARSWPTATRPARSRRSR